MVADPGGEGPGRPVQYFFDIADAVGLSPKRFTRITRIRTVLASGRAQPAQWARLAAITGYYDQSHMTADFHAVMGVPPATFFTGQTPELHPCQPL